MAAAREAQETNGKVKEKFENGEINDKELLMSALPKQKEKEYVYVDREVPVIKEVRVLKDKQGTELSITEIVRQELDLVKSWEYMDVPINQMSVGKLKELGKNGWKFAFDVSPDVSSAYKVTTFIFQRPIIK